MSNRVRRYKAILLTSICVLISSIIPVSVRAQSYLETFGQNRVQHRKFSWKYFDTKHFRVYHYDFAGRKLARYVAEEAEDDISFVEKKLGGQFPKRFNIILYNSYDEYLQTNVGLKQQDQLEENTPAGKVDLVGDRLVVYFTGVHTDLRRQIRMGMTRVVMERMMFGESFRQMVKNALLMNLPPWVTDGYIAYIVDGWDAQSDSQWKNLLSARPKAGFYELSEDYPELAGKAFWKYVSDNYGEYTVKNLLYAMQQKSSLNQGMKEPQTLGLKVTKAYDSCIAYYKRTYTKDSLAEEQPDSTKGLLQLNVPTDNTVVRDIKVSPRGNDVAYVTWKDGEFNIYIQRTKNEKERSLVLNGGRKDYNDQPDDNYPLLCWSNNGYKLAILYKKGSQTRLRIYNSLKAKIENYVIPSSRFDRVLGMTFMEDDEKMVFSAIKRAQTDLYEFTIKRKLLTNITNDAWDDIQPSFISGGSRRGILFLSNRPAPNLNVPQQVNELPTGPMNVFFYDTKTQRPELLQCSHVTSGTITQPIQYGSENFAYLYDANGIRNKYVVVFGRDVHNMDSAYALPITNYAENIISHQYNPASNEVADVLQVGNKYNVYFHDLQMPDQNVTPKKLYPTTLSVSKPQPLTTAESTIVHNNQLRYESPYIQQETAPVITGGNIYQSEFVDTATTKNSQPAPVATAEKPEVTDTTDEADSSKLTVVNDSTYIKMRPSRYRLSFKPDFFAARLDNSVLFNQYQSYDNNGGQFSNPSLSALISVSLYDVLENHRFTGGFQLPVNFSGTAYFLQYENFTNRLDWGLLFLRTQNTYNYLVTYSDVNNVPVVQEEQPGKAITNMLQANFSYPLDRVRSVRFHTALRLDQLNLKPIDQISLNSDVQRNQLWSMSRLEYVFDNTISPALNIRKGFRYKFYGEYMYGLNNGNKNCYNIGLDFRSYQPIYKNLIWATRIAAAHSDGNDKVVYFLGGVDNWINPQYSDYVPVNGGPYGFQSLATSLRGYDQNARNGNNFAVINTELRLPVLTTFIKRPIQSSLLKNLQAVAFIDAGSAWNGFLPNADNTARNYVFSSVGAQPFTQNPIVLQVTVPNSAGLGVGYGAGLRTTVFGYFVRMDAAWNIDGGVKPIWYFSLGTDF